VSVDAGTAFPLQLEFADQSAIEEVFQLSLPAKATLVASDATSASASTLAARTELLITGLAYLRRKRRRAITAVERRLAATSSRLDGSGIGCTTPESALALLMRNELPGEIDRSHS
jgi:hypothetical protein